MDNSTRKSVRVQRQDSLSKSTTAEDQRSDIEDAATGANPPVNTSTNPPTPSTSTKATVESQQQMLIAMQKQINSLSSQLRGTQARLKESECQYELLKSIIQQQPGQEENGVKSNSTAASVDPAIDTAIQPIAATAQPITDPQNGSDVTAQSTSTYATATHTYSQCLQERTTLPTLTATASSLGTTPSISSPPQQTVNHIQDSSYLLSLPRKIQDLPNFDGCAEDWPMFAAAFEQSTATYNYTNFENNQRLQRCLQGEARETVHSLLIHPDNVPAIMDMLRFRFGRPELLIRSQLRQVREMPYITESAVDKIIPFSVKVKNLAVFLQTINGQHHLCNPTLMEELVGKLPMSKKLEWARTSSTIQPYPTIRDFSTWLSGVADLICTVQDSRPNEHKRRVLLQATANIREITCPLCRGGHYISDCGTFKSLSVQERWRKAKQLRLCFSCLLGGHITRTCHRRNICRTNGCQRVHNKLLHESSRIISKPQPAEMQPSQTAATADRVFSCTASTVRKQKVLFRIVPVTVHANKANIETFALLDEGSSITMVDSSLIEQLEIKGYPRRVSLQWLGGRAASDNATIVDIDISGSGLSQKHKLRHVYGIKDLQLPMQSLQKADVDEARLNKLSIQTYANAVPKILIGLDHSHLGIATKIETLQHKGPYAARTKLGWVVFGPTDNFNQGKTSCLHMSVADDGYLHDLVADYFNTESFGVRPAPLIEPDEDKRARRILESTVMKTDGRFQAGLLWRQDDVQLPDSYSHAERRLVGIERKMKRDETFAREYRAVIRDYVNKNYARKLTPDEAAVVSPRTWYLPHFGVTNVNKPGKLRLVFDAAAVVNGCSLNSYLLKGPQQYQPMPTVLFNFRVGAVAVAADIKDMFHQIVIREEDRCAQRFLWRDGDDKIPPEVYEMLVMTFGAACSPCTAQYVKNINALEHRERCPRAYDSIAKHHYVDDFVDSFANVEEATKVANEVKNIHKKAGFELRNFSSNSIEAKIALNGCNSKEVTNSLVTLAVERVLGMYWQPSNDVFIYTLKFHNADPDVISGHRRPTKRELLSIVMSVFDPLGFLSKFMVNAKLLVRETWRYDLRWDESLPEPIYQEWDKWRRQLKNVLNFRVPRHYFAYGLPPELQLHIFVDASEDVFAAVAYWRAVYSDGRVCVVTVCAKTRCAPLKPMTIPRLELQAAVLGTRLLETIINEHSVVVKRRVLWSDSKTVLSWIESGTRRYKPFVAHRVAEILATTNVDEWRWISSRENVADEATRPSATFDIRPTSRWLNGPSFLKEAEHAWPATEKTPDFVHESEELRPKFAMLTTQSCVIDIARFSNLTKLKRSVAWIIRFINKCRRKRNTEGCLTVEELKIAEYCICRLAQSISYSSQLNQLRESGNVPKGSELYKLSPFIDSEGLMRVNGRINAASWLPYDVTRPIILAPNHEFTRLILLDCHNRMKHQNVEATICEVRQKYWVPNIRRVMKKIISKCLVCKISRCTPSQPMMGQLPKDRLTPFMRPFSYTGIDYFGPVNVTIGRRKEKRWVALFTCLTIRAIHLEVAADLSTDACILVIRNFINHRGLPVRIRSDNGKNFVGVNNEGKRFHEVFDCHSIQDDLAVRGVEWIFNCPNNPAEGGIWERMVRCVKRVLNMTLKEVAPREHTLQNLLIEAENIINSRPLTHLPLSPDQDEPLTPNHFLLGTANTAQTPAVNDPVENAFVLRKQWRIARQLRDAFWRRWIHEYLPTLTRRAKWCERSKPLQVGDLVFVCDANMPRKQWCRGRIEAVHHGVDGVIRRADERTSSGVLSRPVAKLAVLDVE
ncbi:uncharacterized protein LOC128921580 [Zeugodacus cucurbitae]|uniref:uncharacterized protein LOC128921580 n=2 Tax=Zeugodacus cucurbitae TaxID=28588 RepID=UPI0023D8FC75|nr:uncharacterized protein LOC128921580 [Zeugodacus cucurbitae]